MKRWIVFTGLLAVLPALTACGPKGESQGPFNEPATFKKAVRPGIEIFIAKHLDLVRGKKIGLITNPSGTDRNLESTAALLLRTPGVELAALYAPEHGIRGDAQAGEYVPYYLDPKFGLPVFSLYGPSQKPQPGMLRDIDETMRSFDTTQDDKKLGAAMTRNIDALLFDIQDVGTRIYTYEATMAYAMQACADSGIEFIVLDRPNPINGRDLEGPILEFPKFSSFIGLYPIPLRFGMTIGELARLFNEKFLDKKAKLTVIPMEGWTRGMWFDETGLPWVAPSPNMPTLSTAIVYPGQVLIEGTNLSEGRGTTRPFEYFGAPWIDGFDLAAKLNALRLPGVIFREQWFTPVFSKFKGELCGGCQIHVTDRNLFRPVGATLHIVATVRAMYPDRFAFHAEYFDKVLGTSAVREALLKGVPVEEIVRGFEPGLKGFEILRESFLLY
jgi:uncharacterized protein YbbC (DUF1343 family)